MSGQNLSMLKKTSWLYAQGGSSKHRGKRNVDSGYGAVYIDVDNSSGSGRQIDGIYGVLKDPLSMSMDTTWTTMDSINVPFVSTMVGALEEISRGVGEVIGGGEVGALWKSKQVWQRSGYLKLSLTFTVVDWDGDGAPLTAARNAYLYITPGGKTEYTQKASDIVGGYLKVADGVVDATVGAWGAGDLASKIKQANHNTIEDADDWFVLKSSPPPVRLRIGQYFDRSDMIIKSVEPKFSKEVTEFGPISVDITIVFESRKIIDGSNTADLGFVESTGRSQVTIGRVQ